MNKPLTFISLLATLAIAAAFTIPHPQATKASSFDYKNGETVQKGKFIAGGSPIDIVAYQKIGNNIFQISPIPYIGSGTEIKNDPKVYTVTGPVNLYLPGVVYRVTDRDVLVYSGNNQDGIYLDYMEQGTTVFY